jgi:hypothetical protein
MTVLLLEIQSSLQPPFNLSQQCTSTRVTELVEAYVECHCLHPDALGTTRSQVGQWCCFFDLKAEQRTQRRERALSIFSTVCTPSESAALSLR